MFCQRRTLHYNYLSIVFNVLQLHEFQSQPETNEKREVVRAFDTCSSYDEDERQFEASFTAVRVP